MSLFDDDESDDYWYDPQDEFQRRVLKNASTKGEHPILYLAGRQKKAVEAMEEFVSQETLLSKREQLAVQSDVEEAEEAIGRAYQLMPSEVVIDDD